MNVNLDAPTNRFLDSLRSLNQGLERTQREIASGKRLTMASDDPDALGALMEARAQTSRLTQMDANLGRLTTEVNTAESAVADAIKLYDRIHVLAMTGANTHQTAETRATLAGEVKNLLDRFVGLANSSVDGRFLFTGDNDQSLAFTIDFQADPPWSAYQGATATRRALHPNGSTFAIAQSADEIFTNVDPKKNVLQTVEDLRQALLADDGDAIAQVMTVMPAVSHHLNTVLGFYGNAQSLLADAKDVTAKMKLQFAQHTSEIEDADMTESVVRLQQLRLQQEAALKARGSVSHMSLFDYLG